MASGALVAADDRVPAAELPPLAGQLLMAATGFVDAYVFLRHGPVFAEAMTGNLVLAGIGLVEPGLIDFVPPLAALVAFLAAVVFAAVVRSRVPRLEPQIATLVVEIVAFAVVTVLPASFPPIVITTGIAFVSGLQIAVFGQLGPVKVTSTVMTSNMRRAVDELVAALRSRRREDLRRGWLTVSAVVAFAVGVVVSAAVCDAIGDRAAVVPAVVVAVVLVLYVRRRR